MKTASTLLRIVMVFAMFAFARGAEAQVTTSYTDSTSTVIDGTKTCTNPVVRNFNVLDNVIVGDVNVGVIATHSYRGDISITLQSPDGTRVRLVDGNAAANTIIGDNFNVLLDDSGAQTVNTDSWTADHPVASPFNSFANTFKPNSPLSAFGSKSSAGLWRLEVCDLYPAVDNGALVYAALYITSAPASWADLSLTMTASTATPAANANITYTLSVTNAAGSPNTATGVTVTGLLPAGLSFVSTNGAYNSSTGVWTVGNLTPGQSKTLTITAKVTAMATAKVAYTAEISDSSMPDLDSTPGNGVTSEDDYASASITVQGTRVAGTAPTLTCTVGSTLFDWDAKTWTAGSLSGSLAQADIGNIAITMSASTGWAAGYPAINNTQSGGLSPVQNGLVQSMDFTTRSDTVTTTFALPTAVPGAQFKLFDVDYSNGGWSDQITVTGTYNGATVTPTLTNGTSNYVVGNTAVGDQTATSTSNAGNVTVTFLSPVDTITIVYGNAATAPSNPTGQVIAIHDITFCKPVVTLSVTKMSTILSDPSNGTTNPKAIPGAVVQYCIMVQNSGSGTATNVSSVDALPATLTYAAGSMASGTSCAAAATAEDDDATGADETDPYGASVSGSTLTATAASLGPGAGFALKFNTTIK